jgi:hypothetical protein
MRRDGDELHAAVTDEYAAYSSLQRTNVDPLFRIMLQQKGRARERGLFVFSRSIRKHQACG